MTSRPPLGVLAGVALVIVALGAWWLHAGDEDRDASVVAPLARTPRAGDARIAAETLPEAGRAAQPVPLDVGAVTEATAPVLAAAETEVVAEPPPETLAELRGRVLDARGAPLVGATVVYWPDATSQEELYGLPTSAWGPALDVLPRTLTDGGGRFALEGRVFLPFVAEGEPRPPVERRVAVLLGEFAPRSRSVTCPPDQPCDLGDIALEPGGRLTGRVVDERGVPLSGVEVVCRSQRAEPRELPQPPGDARFAEAAASFGSTFTGSDGRFRTGPQWNGVVSLRLDTDGMQPLWVRGERVTAGETRDLGELVLVPALTLSGRVVDASRAPVAGALVAAEPSSDGASTGMLGGFNEDSLLREARRAVSEGAVPSGPDGAFMLSELLRAPHEVYVVAEGFEPAHLAEVQPGGLPLVVVLERLATLRLRVVDAASGQPVNDASVDVERGGQWPNFPGARLAVAPGPEPGTWDAPGVGVAPVQVHVTAPGRVELRRLVDGVAPPGLVERTVELPRESLVTGRVTDAKGAPIAGVAVKLLVPPAPAPDEPGPMLPTSVAVTEADGRYALHALGAGEFTLRASEEGHASAERKVTLQAETPLAGVDFELEALAGVSGIASFTDGSVAPGVQFVFRRMSGDGPSGGTAFVKTGPDGSFARNGLQPGTWDVLRAPKQTFTLAPGEQRVLDVRLTTPTRLAGLVTDAAGVPVKAGVVYVTRPRPDGKLQGPTALRCDADGRFGTATDAGPALLVAVSADGGLSPLAEVTVTAETTTFVAMQVAVGRAEVRLRDATSGEPVADARVALLPLVTGDEAAVHTHAYFDDWHLDLSQRSDAAGVARFPGIGPGRYRVEVSGSALLAQPLPPVIVAENAPAVFDVAVVRPAELRGVVRDAAGQPPDHRLFAQIVGADGVAIVSDFVRDGRFAFKGLVPGPVTVQVTRDREALVEQPVVLIAGQSADVELTLPP